MTTAQLLLILAQAIGLGLLIYAPCFWVKLDAARINHKPAEDTLLATFHRHRLTWRVLSTAAVALLFSLPALWAAVPYWPLVAALLLFGACYFFAKFNPALNVALMPTQPYKSKWFVSWNPAGSSLDVRLWRLGYFVAYGGKLTAAILWKFVKNDLPPAIVGPDARTQAVAGRYLETLSNAAEAAAFTLYPAIVLTTLILQWHRTL